MWLDFYNKLDTLGPASELIPTLIVGSGLLTLLSIGFAAFALGSHAWSLYQARIWTQRKKDWNRQIVDVLAGGTPPQSLVDEVDMKHFSSFIEVLSPYATVVTGAEKRLTRALAAPFMHEVKANLSSRRPLIRAQAVQRLGLLGGEADATSLRKMLNDPVDRVVERVLSALSRVGGPKDTEPLLRCLPRLDHVDRRQISSSLFNLGEDAAPWLRAAMADDSRADFVRVCSADTLRELGDTAAADVAAWLLDDAKFARMTKLTEVTASLLRVLRRLGKGVHGPLIRSYCHAQDPVIRLQAARALGQLGSPKDEVLLGALVYSDNSRWVALSAARSLIELGSTTPLRKLQTLEHPRAQLARDFLLPPDQ